MGLNGSNSQSERLASLVRCMEVPQDAHAFPKLPSGMGEQMQNNLLNSKSWNTHMSEVVPGPNVSYSKQQLVCCFISHLFL